MESSGFYLYTCAKCCLDYTASSIPSGLCPTCGLLMNFDQAPEIQDIRKTTFTPDDILVVRLARQCSEAALSVIGRKIKEQFGFEVKCIILWPGIDIEVIKKSAQDERIAEIMGEH